MAVDWIRRPYTTWIRPFKDSSHQEQISWYIVPDDTPFLPFYTRFASRLWDNERQMQDGPGEVQGAPRPYSANKLDNKRLNRIPCGTAEQFAGESLDDGTLVWRGSYGFLSCCWKQQPGLVVGGTAFQDWHYASCGNFVATASGVGGLGAQLIASGGVVTTATKENNSGGRTWSDTGLMTTAENYAESGGRTWSDTGLKTTAEGT